MKNSSLKYYHLIADVFDFPTAGFDRRVENVYLYIKDNYTELADELYHFVEYVKNTSITEQEEIYTRTFDVQAITTMDLGYVLFGDDYKRGELLSNLNREHTAVNNELNNQLPDHLPSILRLLPKIKDEELLHELTEEIIIPAIEKIISEFNQDRIIKKNEIYEKHYKTLIQTSEKFAVIYQHTFRTLLMILLKDFNIQQKSLPEKNSDFLRSLNTELELESSNK